jgi:Icc-related predicted phosphoesterase
MRLFLFLTFLSFFIFEKNSAQVLTRGPYMNMATSNSIVIRWRTDVPCNSQVKYGTNKNNLNVAVNTAALVTDHIVTLSTLNAETRYFYSIGTSLLTFQGDSQNYFHTAPVASAIYNKPVRFWAVGDMAKNTPQETAVINAFEKHTDTLPVNGFILLGDNAYPLGYDANYQDGFFNYYQKSITKHIVLWPCLGNHDYANDYNRRVDHLIPYLDIFSNPQNGEMGGIASNNERYYSYNIGNVHFINLDSYGLENVSGTYYGLADTAFSPQVQWLKYDLSLNTLPWVIVSYHHPPYCMGTHNSDAETDLGALRTNINPILEKYNVDLVLNGHCHTYQRSNMIRNHFGLESSFDSTLNLVQNSSGRYDGSPNSCLYIKNNVARRDSGVIYAVVGSGSAVPQLPMAQWPHNAMQYSNYLDNGSIYISVHGNELNAEWISTDTSQVVKDRFTILKNANKLKKVFCSYPAILTLEAAWHTAPFMWSTGDSTQSIQFLATHDTVLYVSDHWNCITDTFQIMQAAPASVSDQSNFDARIYPNPTRDEISVDVPSAGLYGISIYSENGVLIYQESLPVKGKTVKLSLKDKIASGNYIVAVKNERNAVFTTKITVSE